MEGAVQVAKRILRNPQPFLSFPAYCNTPMEVTGFALAQLLKGRNLDTLLPVVSQKLVPKWPNFEQVHSNDQKAKLQSSRSFSKTHGARKLSNLKSNQDVRIRLPGEKNWSEHTKIFGKLSQNPYLVRNQKHLLPIPDPKLKVSTGDTQADIPREEGAEDKLETGNALEPSDTSVDNLPKTDTPYVNRYGRTIDKIDIDRHYRQFYFSLTFSI